MNTLLNSTLVAVIESDIDMVLDPNSTYTGDVD